MNTKSEIISPIRGIDNVQFEKRLPKVISGKKIPLLKNQKIVHRFLKISEIVSKSASSQRSAMANVLSILNGGNTSVVYILSGTEEGVDLYVGIAQKEAEDERGVATELLRSSLEGNFPGVQLDKIHDDDNPLEDILAASKYSGCVLGVPSFNEPKQGSEDEDFQGIERLVDSLAGETWQFVLVAEPGSDDELHEQIQQLYDISTELSGHVKQSYQVSHNYSTQNSDTEGKSKSETDGTNTSTGGSDGTSKTKGKNTGGSSGSNRSSGSSGPTSGTNKSKSWGDSTSDSRTKGTSYNRGESKSVTLGMSDSETRGTGTSDGLSMTQDRHNKRIEEMQKHINESAIERFNLGIARGMYKVSIYISALHEETYRLLSRSVLSIYQGDQVSTTPLQITDLEKTKTFEEVLQPQFFRNENVKCGSQLNKTLLAHGVPFDEVQSTVQNSTWLNTQEISLYAGLPNREIPGIRLRKNVKFAANTRNQDSEAKIKLGNIVHNGRELRTKPAFLSHEELNKHVSLFGATGGGKTTSAIRIITESKLPYLVIEPAKTEYRALYNHDNDVEYYVIGREDITTFRLNPFELVSKEHYLAGHISILTATLTAVFPMEAAMPQLVEEAIIDSYKKLGWDIHSSENLFIADPWDLSNDETVWPTFSDFICALEGIIKSKGMGAEFEEKYLGSLVAKFTNLTKTSKGRMLNVRRSIDFGALLDKKVVIELEAMPGDQDKALIMGLIVTRLAECMKQRHQKDHNFKHITLLEEAHRLLEKPEAGDGGAKKHGLNMFANLLAEVRKYGECLIIADQSPGKLIPDVIKNTNTKIVHRLLSEDDHNMVGNSMMLEKEQKEFLPMLNPGEAVIYSGGWHSPVRVQIEQVANTNGKAIDVSTIKKIGVGQLWVQRERIFKLISLENFTADEKIFSSAVKMMDKLRALFLQLNYYKQGEKNKRNEVMIRKLICSFGKKWTVFTSMLNLTEGAHESLFSSFMLDVSAVDEMIDAKSFDRALSSEINLLMRCSNDESTAEASSRSFEAYTPWLLQQV